MAYRLTVTYPNEPNGKFDFTYYRDKHMPMVRARLGANVTRTEIGKGVAAGDGAKAGFICVGQVWFKSLSDMQAGMKQHGAEIMGDIPNYTNIKPAVQIEELVE
jgi:uncharacterized protein (TIGR02118 family)